MESRYEAEVLHRPIVWEESNKATILQDCLGVDAWAVGDDTSFGSPKSSAGHHSLNEA
jgi:hypothetical protein